MTGSLRLLHLQAAATSFCRSPTMSRYTSSYILPLFFANPRSTFSSLMAAVPRQPQTSSGPIGTCRIPPRHYSKESSLAIAPAKRNLLNSPLYLVKGMYGSVNCERSYASRSTFSSRMAAVSRQPQTWSGPIGTRRRPSPPRLYCKESPLAIAPEKRTVFNSPLYLVKGMHGLQTYRSGDASSGELQHHRILFKDDTFTVEGGEYRRVDDPANEPFLKSLLNKEVPAEFGNGGYHVITIMRFGDEDWDWVVAYKDNHPVYPDNESSCTSENYGSGDEWDDLQNVANKINK